MLKTQESTNHVLPLRHTHTHICIYNILTLGRLKIQTKLRQNTIEHPKYDIPFQSDIDQSVNYSIISISVINQDKKLFLIIIIKKKQVKISIILKNQNKPDMLSLTAQQPLSFPHQP